MKKSYGNIIPGLILNAEPAEYPVVNEREIRAAAGIMFLIGFSTLAFTFFTKNLVVVSVVLPLFWLDFFLKTIFSPSWSIFGMIAKPLVANQKPEYVGAVQKRFAWAIGLTLATTMILLLFVFSIRGIVPLSLCAICLFFMWMESSLGICVGCKIYYALVSTKLIKEPEQRPACPGGVCSLDKKH